MTGATTAKATVLVLGASGFIGRHLVARLLERGYAVTCAGRNVIALRQLYPTCHALKADLARDTPESWTARLAGFDAVVNAAGLLRGDLDGVQQIGPIALFDACDAIGIARVVQVSALGAGTQQAAFLTTKHAADMHLLRLAKVKGRAWCVLRPSLVIGPGGASTAVFSALAALPRPVRLGPGTWTVQPIHVDDVTCAIADLLACPAVPSSLDLVGPSPMTTDALTACLRSWLCLPARPPIPVPESLLRLAAVLGRLLPDAALTPDSLAMLAAGNTADPAPAVAYLGWATRPLDQALASQPARAADRLAARMLPVRPALLACLGAVWIGSAFVSSIAPSAHTQSLLAHLGLFGAAADTAIWVGAGLDLALGLTVLHRASRRVALVAQLIAMGAYTALATLALPSLWLDPLGPLLKNFAVLAATLALLAMEEA